MSRPTPSLGMASTPPLTTTTTRATVEATPGSGRPTGASVAYVEMPGTPPRSLHLECLLLLVCPLPLLLIVLCGMLPGRGLGPWPWLITQNMPSTRSPVPVHAPANLAPYFTVHHPNMPSPLDSKGPSLFYPSLFSLHSLILVSLPQDRPTFLPQLLPPLLPLSLILPFSVHLPSLP